jgi:hypothetical protein
MKSYKVFEHPSGDMEAIKEDWSWTAFLFGWIWALCHGMWLVALGVLGARPAGGIRCARAGRAGLVHLVVTALYGIVNSIVLGSIGNSLRASWQVGKGYACVGVVQASNAEEALSAHRERSAAKVAQVSPPPVDSKGPSPQRSRHGAFPRAGPPPHPSTPFAVPPIRPA